MDRKLMFLVFALFSKASAELSVSSGSFMNNDYMPVVYTCEGKNTSPSVKVKGMPSTTQSLALIVEDPDAPKGTVTHWIMWNIKPNATIDEASHVGVEGKNTKGESNYMGPCPPDEKPHHYHFKVYALDRMLELPAGSDKQKLEAAMKGHIVAQGELVGLYKKQTTTK